MNPKAKDQFDMVKMAEAANRKAQKPKEAPIEFRKRLVNEFKTLMAPVYDNHSFEAVLSLKSYRSFERAKIGKP